MIGLFAVASITLSAAQTTAQVTVPSAPAVFTLPPNSCHARAGEFDGKGATLPAAIDGTKLKKPSEIDALRSKAKGATVVIEGGDFSGAKFGGDYSNVCFRGTKLTATRWIKTRAAGAAFINVDLSGALFDRANLDYVLLRNTTLARVEAAGVRMNYGRFDGGWDPSISGLRLDNAEMTGFKFVCGTSALDGCAFDRKQMSLRGANLTGANIASFALWDTVLDNVRINQTEISVDQITQLAKAIIAGPVILRIDRKRISLAPDALAAAAQAISATKTEDTSCVNPETPLDQILCQSNQAPLRNLRADVDNFYGATQENSRPADGASIVVQGLNTVQQKYQKTLRKCALRDEDVAITCLYKAITKRRTTLVSQLLAARPLESDARALYVSPQTPLAQAITKDPKLAGLMSLVIDTSPHLLLAYRDDDDGLIAHSITQTANGKRCAIAFAPPPLTKSRRKVATGPSFAAWATGAEFTIVEPEPVKAQKKKKVRKKKGQIIETAPTPIVAAVPTGCGSLIQSGPLVRLPISEDDFDRLWAGRKSRL